MNTVVSKDEIKEHERLKVIAEATLRNFISTFEVSVYLIQIVPVNSTTDLQLIPPFSYI